jgi:hypothetical protein
MNQTVELPESKMEIRFRVIARKPGGKSVMISTWSTYMGAEQSCWRYPATDDSYELYIEKVWIRKSTQTATGDE